MFGPVLPNLRDVSTCRGGSLSCNAILGGNWFWNIYAGHCQCRYVYSTMEIMELLVVLI